MNNTVLPHSVQRPHLVAFDLLMKQRLDNLQLDALLVYMINSVDESALYWLALQFDLMNYNGWKLADTEEKKRELIKKGIELHRYKGTVWSIKEALRTVGYPKSVVTEHVTHWAGFSIQLNAGDNAVGEDQIEEALGMVRAYKNVRSHLIAFDFLMDEAENLHLSDDSFDAPGQLLEDSLFAGGNFTYNGDHKYDGEKNYSSDSDTLELTIT